MHKLGKEQVQPDKEFVQTHYKQELVMIDQQKPWNFWGSCTIFQELVQGVCGGTSRLDLYSITLPKILVNYLIFILVGIFWRFLVAFLKK